jgi:aminoglycoside 3-N-acetyltransferase I
MTSPHPKTHPTIHRLDAQNDTRFGEALDLFASAFDDPENYSTARPSPGYRRRLISKRDFIMLVAVADQKTVGALAAYELEKFEQERSEFYIYDLAVSPEWRRCGIATNLIIHLREIAATLQSKVVFVQADHGDDPAIALYTKLGTREDVIHFDIPVTPKQVL